MKTFFGYASIALAVLGLAGYVLRPAVRTMPWYKFAGAVIVMLVIGIGLIAIDAVKETKTASEARPAPSSDKEILARTLHDWKDAYGRRDGYITMWSNLLSANIDKQELDSDRFTTLESLVSYYKEQCDRFLDLQSNLQKMGDRGARQNAEAAVALTLARCKVVSEWMGVTVKAISPDMLASTHGTVKHNALAAMQVYQSQLLESKDREFQALQLFTSALTALGMNPDLKSY